MYVALGVGLISVRRFLLNRYPNHPVGCLFCWRDGVITIAKIRRRSERQILRVARGGSRWKREHVEAYMTNRTIRGKCEQGSTVEEVGLFDDESRECQST